MFKRLFGRGRAANRDDHGRALRANRGGGAAAACFMPSWNVPDTPLGRFEMVSLHMFLVLHRLRGEAARRRDVAQNLTDTFFADVEHSLRELGIGDLGVPKRMKKLARMFYGRAVAYGEALDRGDRGIAGRGARPQRPAGRRGLAAGCRACRLCAGRASRPCGARRCPA